MNLKERILDISYREKLSHLGSNLTAVDIIKDIYKLKKLNERFVLSSGHAGLALYVVLESLGLGDAERMLREQGIHPDRMCDTLGIIDCSTGSLGQGLPIALGMAMADRDKNVYCLISDGECSEGSIWEALMVAEKKRVNNLKIYVNMNGWGAFDPIDVKRLAGRLMDMEVNMRIYYTDVEQYPFLKGQSAHYYTMKPEDHDKAARTETK